MPRIKELVRIATLARHFQDGLVSLVEIIDDGERLSVCVHYNEKAEGEKVRFLTAHKKAGPRRFASLATAWRFLNLHGVEKALLRKATDDEKVDIYAQTRALNK
jgi:hypothetical protein